MPARETEIETIMSNTSELVRATALVATLAVPTVLNLEAQIHGLRIDDEQTTDEMTEETREGTIEEKTDETRLTPTSPQPVSEQDVLAVDLHPTAVDLALPLRPTETEAICLPTATALLHDDTPLDVTTALALALP
jgi:hypothetical protein